MGNIPLQIPWFPSVCFITKSLLFIWIVLLSFRELTVFCWTHRKQRLVVAWCLSIHWNKYLFLNFLSLFQWMDGRNSAHYGRHWVGLDQGTCLRCLCPTKAECSSAMVCTSAIYLWNNRSDLLCGCKGVGSSTTLKKSAWPWIFCFLNSDQRNFYF
jgi:hypothetical protein